MSTDVSIGQALVAVKRDVGAVRKGERNTKHNFSFRGIDAVVNAVSGALIQHGVTVYPAAVNAEYGTIEAGNNRTTMGHVTVKVTYRWLGPAGDYIDSVVPGEAMDSGDKAGAKAMSVAYRTALLQTLTLPTDETDPDAESFQRSPEPQQITEEDSVNESRGKLWIEAQRQGWSDANAFAEAFAGWSGGVAIAAADRELLTRCNAALQAGTFDPTPTSAASAASDVVEGEVVA